MKSKFLKLLIEGKLTQAHRDAISKANTGKTIPEETRQRMSQSHKGMKYTKETKKRTYTKLMNLWSLKNITPEKWQKMQERLKNWK